jgi:hypothetical protein
MRYWDIKRTSREMWTADDWAIHKFIKNLMTRGTVQGNRIYLIIYNATKPSKSTIIMEMM